MDSSASPLCIILPLRGGGLNKLKNEVSKALALILTGYPLLARDEDAIHQILESFPEGEFFISYGGFAKAMLLISPSLYSEVMDALYTRYIFIVRTTDVEFDGVELESLGHEAISHIRYLHFEIAEVTLRDTTGSYQDNGKRVTIFDTWKGIMERTRNLLSYHRLHLIITCHVSDRRTTAAVLDVIENLPQMKDCSVDFPGVRWPFWRRKLRRVVKDLTVHEKNLKGGKHSPVFHNYLDLPLELRLIVLSYTELVPVRGEYDDSPKWKIRGSVWFDGKSCCGKCSANLLFSPCCCNFHRHSFSTTCECGEGFYSMLMVSQQFRAEALQVLYLNDFSIEIPYYGGTVNSLSQFLDWPPSIPNLSHVKRVVLKMASKELQDWQDDDRNFRHSLTKRLTTFVKHCGPSSVVSLELEALRENESWCPLDWEKLQLFESDLCKAVEKVYLDNPNRCMIYIDWRCTGPNVAPDSKSWPVEDARSDVRDQSSNESGWDKSKWLLNSPIQASRQ